MYCPFTSSPVFVALTRQGPSQQIVRDDTHGTLRPESIGGMSIQNEASFVHYAPNKSNRSNSICSGILKSLPWIDSLSGHEHKHRWNVALRAFQTREAHWWVRQDVSTLFLSTRHTIIYLTFSIPTLHALHRTTFVPNGSERVVAIGAGTIERPRLLVDLGKHIPLIHLPRYILYHLLTPFTLFVHPMHPT